MKPQTDLTNGWFVYAENADQIWYCNGSDLSVLKFEEKLTKNSSVLIDSSLIPTIPQKVLSHAPKELMEKISSAQEATTTH
ncbi:hypothetical protein [Persicirhabdus sediminis]|uniref:Uncharacterized protein n=1 Tax=Persicirhabdus sediminis TaxID=454144 RepID=A0A8J7ME22_9BACT|nr:hypothetical protein [Persicirhabdus sediminis]MBK1790129.1 hypothetical protein [Persicirhabdus sediminis]